MCIPFNPVQLYTPRPAHARLPCNAPFISFHSFTLLHTQPMPVYLATHPSSPSFLHSLHTQPMPLTLHLLHCFTLVTPSPCPSPLQHILHLQYSYTNFTPSHSPLRAFSLGTLPQRCFGIKGCSAHHVSLLEVVLQNLTEQLKEVLAVAPWTPTLCKLLGRNPCRPRPSRRGDSKPHLYADLGHLKLAADVAYGSKQRRDPELNVSRALLKDFGLHEQLKISSSVLAQLLAATMWRCQ